MRVVLYLLPLCVVLNACTLSQKEMISVAEQNQNLLQQQGELMQAQHLQLSDLIDTQDALAEQVSNLQSEINVLGKKVADEKAITRTLIRQNSTGNDSVGVVASSAKKKEQSRVRGKAILGRVEYAWLEDVNQYLKARIDTGAKSSSLNATKIQRFERDGDRWVRFDVAMSDSEVVTVEAPLVRHVRIRQASIDELERRPVVKLHIRLGEIDEETEFTLSDRRNMLYPILLGRSFLRDIVMVDVAKKFTRRRDSKLMEKASEKVAEKVAAP